MKSPVYTSANNYIGNHKLIAEIGYVCVEAKEFKKEGGLWDAFLAGLTGGDYKARFASYTEALVYLKDKVREMAGNGIINIHYTSTSIDGIAVLVKE